MIGFPFQVDFNDLGAHTFTTVAGFHDWLGLAREGLLWPGDAFVLNALVAPIEAADADPVPAFGYRGVHHGDFTLREYLAAHKIPFPPEES